MLIRDVVSWPRLHKAQVVYAVLSVVTAFVYLNMVSLLAVQTAWVNVPARTGRFTVSILAALVAWSWIVDKVSKRRNWSTRKSWSISLAGVAILLIVIAQ